MSMHSCVSSRVGWKGDHNCLEEKVVKIRVGTMVTSNDRVFAFPLPSPSSPLRVVSVQFSVTTCDLRDFPERCCELTHSWT